MLSENQFSGKTYFYTLTFRCDLCDYSSIFMSKLEWHKKHSHAETILRRLPCDRCEYSAPSEGKLRDHKETVHENIRDPIQ